MLRRPLARGSAPFIAAVALLCSACTEGGRWDLFRRKPPPEPKPEPVSECDTILADTIGARTLIGGGQAMRLRGFGVVVGLGDNGGSDCPSTIREYLVEYFAREFAAQAAAGRTLRVSPQRLVDSLDTAVVVVYGMVPPGAPPGARFDLQLEAVGTQTRSLEGGLLLPCEMRRFDAAAAGKGLVAGRVLARARGMIFSNPFKGPDQTRSPQRLRRGYVLGGGKTTVPRTVRLLLEEPSYSMARRIEGRINERFGQNPRVAEAMSRGYLTLTTPADYADRPDRFIELTTHLLLERTAGQVERKLIELSRELNGSDEKLNHISLIWEGMGRTVIPHIQPLYTHANAAAGFYAMRAGLRLGDVTALPVMGRIAATPGHKYQLLAVRELAQCGLRQATRWLAPLLDSDDQEIRIATYEGLCRYGHPAVERQCFVSVLDPTEINLRLDVVESNARPLIYIRRTREPRIAVLGDRTPVSLPMFYNHPQNWVTLNALEEKGDIGILCRTRSGRLTTEPLMVPPRAAELIRALATPPVPDENGQMEGIGLGYTQVVEVLDELCNAGTIPARLVLESGTITDLLGPAELPERPEADQVSLLPEERPEREAAESAEEMSDATRQQPE